MRQVIGVRLSGQPEDMALPDTRSRFGLVRPRRRRIIAGVCAAIARRYDMSPTLVRVLFVASLLLPGPQVLAYLALWALVPEEPLA